MYHSTSKIASVFIQNTDNAAALLWLCALQPTSSLMLTKISQIEDLSIPQKSVFYITLKDGTHTNGNGNKISKYSFAFNLTCNIIAMSYGRNFMKSNLTCYLFKKFLIRSQYVSKKASDCTHSHMQAAKCNHKSRLLAAEQLHWSSRSSKGLVSARFRRRNIIHSLKQPWFPQMNLSYKARNLHVWNRLPLPQQSHLCHIRNHLLLQTEFHQLTGELVE